MKIKNLTKLFLMMLVLIASSAMFLVSCNDDDEFVQGDLTALNALIADAEAMSAAATPTDYPQSAIDNFNTTLASVKTAAAEPLTQTEIDNLYTQLNQAMILFDSQAYGYIDESLYLNAGWHFDEGSGTTATAFSTTKHVATFTKGNTAIMADAMNPSWVAGLNGGSAVYVNKGAHLETPYNPLFLPTDLSISVWVKPDELYENNYILSQNFWTGYKLQTQGGGKPFFTFKKVDGGIIDADNETDNSIRAGEWNHIVISLDGTAKTLKFYIDGTLTKTWDEANKGIGPLTQTLVKPDPQPFIIGCVITEDEYYNDPDNTWSTWGQNETNFGYFKGVIDELKIYNIALTDGQVSKLYNEEKP